MMPMAYDIGNTTSLNVSCKVGATILVCDLCWTPKFKSTLSYMDSFDGTCVTKKLWGSGNYVLIIKKIMTIMGWCRLFSLSKHNFENKLQVRFLGLKLSRYDGSGHKAWVTWFLKKWNQVDEITWPMCT